MSDLGEVFPVTRLAYTGAAQARAHGAIQDAISGGGGPELRPLITGMVSIASVVWPNGIRGYALLVEDGQMPHVTDGLLSVALQSTPDAEPGDEEV